jgi:hypothetical protein
MRARRAGLHPRRAGNARRSSRLNPRLSARRCAGWQPPQIGGGELASEDQQQRQLLQGPRAAQPRRAQPQHRGTAVIAQPPRPVAEAEAPRVPGHPPVGSRQDRRAPPIAAKRERRARAHAPGLRLVHHYQQHRPGLSLRGHRRSTPIGGQRRRPHGPRPDGRNPADPSAPQALAARGRPRSCSIRAKRSAPYRAAPSLVGPPRRSAFLARHPRPRRSICRRPYRRFASCSGVTLGVPALVRLAGVGPGGKCTSPETAYQAAPATMQVACRSSEVRARPNAS